MKVARLIKTGFFALSDEDMPADPNPHEALIQVKAAGICGTDLHIWKQGRSDVALPRILGHELAGIVIKTGSAVTHIAVGDKVVLDPVISCGACRSCQAGRPNVCRQVKCFGVQCDGGFREYLTIPAAGLYAIPPWMAYTEACLAEPLSVAANISSRAAVGRGDHAVIIGAGTIGLAALCVFKALEAQVLISDFRQEKLKIARELGADQTVGSEGDLEAAAAAFCPGGADVVLDAVGKSDFLPLAMRLAAPAARIAVIGFDAAAAPVAAADITRKELTIVGSRMNNHCFPQVIRWLESGAIRTERLLSAVYPLEQIQEAFVYAANNPDGIKTVITLS